MRARYHALPGHAGRKRNGPFLFQQAAEKGLIAALKRCASQRQRSGNVALDEATARLGAGEGGPQRLKPRCPARLLARGKLVPIPSLDADWSPHSSKTESYRGAEAPLFHSANGEC